jgi:DNA-binding FrmR family transcriptional regulator
VVDGRLFAEVGAQSQAWTYPLPQDRIYHMSEDHRHATHPQVVKRLKRAGGHLQSVVGMIETGRGCLDVVQQLHAVEKAIAQAKKTLIQDHIDHCLEDALGPLGRSERRSVDEFKEITKYL